MDDLGLQQQYGAYFRGFSMPLPGDKLPDYLTRLEYDAGSDSHFDHLIYVTNTTCLDKTTFVLTFAHELQHFFQYWCARKIWAMSTLLYWNVLVFEPDALLTAINIPHEREANIVSKRVAETICTPTAVKEFAENQVARFTHLAQRGNDENAVSENADGNSSGMLTRPHLLIC